VEEINEPIQGEALALAPLHPLQGSALKEAVDLSKKIGQPITTEQIHYALVPNDCKVESLLNLQYPEGLPPSRIRHTVTMKSADSFAAYVMLYADQFTRIFADPDKFYFRGALDFHGTKADNLEPKFVSHNVQFTMTQDDRWKIWRGMDGKPFSQAEFAEFIEDNRRDIEMPDPATMLEIARSLEAKTDVNFRQATNLQNGQVQIRYEEVVTAGVPNAGNIEVPTEFTIRIPVFFGEPPLSIPVRLRFRLHGGKLTFHYKLFRPLETEQDAFKAAVDQIGRETEQKVLIGTI
jgi:uncharacterized protein YfdQ (DUF2303 family)